MKNEVTIDAAFEEVRQHAETAIALTDKNAYADEPTVSRQWFSPAKTFIYHTVSAINGANHTTLDAAALVFSRANQLKSQPWYPAFLGGWSEPMDTALPSCVTSAARGQASFDFGLRKPRYYNQLIASFSLDENTRGIALRSIEGLPELPNQIKAYTLSPTVDLLRLRGGKLEWHHIVTVAGPALLPPGADRLLMNALRRLHLDHAERKTYLDEANRLAVMGPIEWANLRAQLQS